MGLKLLVSECSGVFNFLRDFFGCLPLAIRTLVFGAFGGSVFLAALKSVWR